MVAATDKVAVAPHLPGGECHDAPEGRKAIETLKGRYEGVPPAMDKAYEDGQTRGPAQTNGYPPVVPPKSNRAEPWEYDKETYKKRNIAERFFRHLKGFRRICTRYDKTDCIFMAHIQMTLVFYGSNSVNAP